MAAGRKEYELQMKLTAALGSNFNSAFQGAMSTVKKLQGTLQNVKKVQGDISAYKKTQEAINATKAKVQEYETKHNTLQNELAQTVAKEKELQKALRDSEKSAGKESEEYKNLQKQLQNTRNEKSKLKSQIKDNERATDAANTKIKEQQQKLSELSRSLQAAGVNTDRLTQENDKLEKAYKRMQKAQEDYARVNSAIEQNKAAISATKTELMKTVGVLGTAGAAFYKGFITPAANLQEQMSTVKSLISASRPAEEVEADMAKLKAAAQKMGATTKFTAVEAGKALEYMGMAGWNATQMEAGLPGIMNLAAASGEDLGAVSDIVTDAMTAFGMTADRAGYFADVLARTATSANTNVGLMGETFQQVAPLAGAMGYTIDDMSVAIGMMANAGIKGSKSGVALKNVITNLAKPSDEAKAAMQKLNISLVDSKGKTKSFEEVVISLRKGFSGLTEAEKAAYASTIGGKQGMAGLLAIVNSGEEDFAKLTAQIQNCTGAAEKMAETRLDNLNGDVTLAKSAWSGFATTIGDLFIPNMRTAVQKVTEFLNKANEFAQANPQLIKQIAGVAAGLGALKVGSLAGKLGFLEMEGGILKTVKSFIGLRVEAAESAAAAATGGGKFATLGKNIAGYFGNIKGLAGKATSDIAKELSGTRIAGAASKFGGFIKSGILKPINGLSGKVKGALGGVGNAISGVFSKIASGPIGNGFKQISGAFSAFGKGASAVLGGPLKALGGMFGGLFGKAMPLIAIISALSMVLLKLSGEDISGFIEPLKTAFEQMKPVLQSALTQFKELGNQMLPLIVKAAKQLAPLLGQIITAILPVVIQLIQSLVPLIIQLVQELLPVALNIITMLAPLLTQIITAVLPIVVQLLRTLLPIITQLASSVLPIVVEVINMIIPLVNDLIQAVLPVLMGLLQALMPVIQTLADLFTNVLGMAIEGIKPIIESLMGLLKGIIDFVVGVFTGDWGKAWEGVKSIFENIINGIVSIFKMPINAIIDGINSFIGGLNKLKIPDWVPFVGGRGLNLSLIPKLEKGSNFTPDTFIAGDVNGKGGELVTGARGRKVFTAAETSEIFKNINAAKAVNESVPRESLIQRVGGAANTVRNAISERLQGGTPSEVPTRSGGEIKFEIHYSPTIYVDGNKPGDLEEKLEQNNKKLMQEIKEVLRQERENERRTTYA